MPTYLLLDSISQRLPFQLDLPGRLLPVLLSCFFAACHCAPRFMTQINLPYEPLDNQNAFRGKEEPALKEPAPSKA